MFKSALSWFISWFLLLYLYFCLFVVSNFCHQFSPTFKSCFSILDSKNILSYIKGILCPRPYKMMLISFSAHIFFTFFITCPTYWTLRHAALKVLVFLVSLSTYSVIYSENMLSTGQTLIMGLKCSRVSFLPSSYSEKMCWGRGYECTITANNCPMKQSVH